MRTKYNPAKIGVLEELRQDGFKVFVTHRRLLAHSVWDGEHVRDFLPDDDNVFVSRHEIQSHNIPWGDISPTGGVTQVNLYQNDELISEGIAYCCTNDAFNKHLGLTIALGRALKALPDEAPANQ